MNNRLALLIACLGMTAAGTCLAEDAAFCKSMCASEQRQCRADARLQPKEERLMPPDTPDHNPLARTAQGEVPSQAARALEAAGADHRRADRLGSCDTSYQRCTRSCAVPADAQRKTAAPAVTGRAS